jgi:hypothetical protein
MKLSHPLNARVFVVDTRTMIRTRNATFRAVLILTSKGERLRTSKIFTKPIDFPRAAVTGSPRQALP